ncbi:type II toxin-antitoxin system CcdA family antitoxin [Mycobacterium riyadhense]|uniref:type II toxin-antitoxin system CcdA family antitoxin n=1 Tax=Mycobacterium riyadhense TaxID=486698 RepID=UPI0030B8A0DB
MTVLWPTARFIHAGRSGHASSRDANWCAKSTLNQPDHCIAKCRRAVYVPDQLAEQARSRGLNISGLTQAAIADELKRTSVSAWLDGLPTVGQPVDHDAALAALDEARDEFGT